jgi:ELP3 family radical SAM enzyme/protein acetyltransferase
VNRGHDNATSIKAISTLKANGFKVDLHIMPDLPGCNPEMDKKMMEIVLNSPNYSPDYLKIYPCLDVDFTEIKKWKESGKWVPYSENDISKLIDVILHAKIHSKYYTRFNRIQRDFSEAKNGAIGFQSKTIKTNLRQIVQNEAHKQGVVCKCIRCCEIKSKRINKNNIQFHIDTYDASFGIEKYISFYSDKRKTLHGFIRVRFNQSNQYVAFNKLKDCALIRELHVYGFVKKTSETKNNEIVSDGNQHVGFGKALLAFAEMSAVIKGYRKIAVISGVGVRNYYRRHGYLLQDEKDGYLVKEIDPWCTPYYIFRAMWYYITVLLRVWLLLRS